MRLRRSRVRENELTEDYGQNEGLGVGRRVWGKAERRLVMV